MSGFSGLDFMAKALENAQKQADQMLGIDEHAAKEAMEESASEALKLGQHLNVPLARWSVAFLPHQQARVANHEKLRLRD